MKTNLWMIGLVAAALVGCVCAPEGEKDVIVIGPDGPSLVQVRDRIRAERRSGAKGPRTVRLKPGTYNLTETFALGPEDSFVTYVADGDVTVTGSRPLGAWTVEKDGSWSARIDWVRPDRTGGFRMLRVGGEPRPRARLPKTGYYEVVNDDLPPKTRYNAPRSCCFLKPEEFHFDWPHIEDLEMIVYHFWNDSHLRIASTDPASNKVTFVAACGKAFDTGWSNNKSGGLRGIYVLENFPAAMTEPGEWWLDHAGQTLHYLPKPGEDPRTARAEVPYVRTLVSIAGEPEKDGRFAEDIVFRGIRFTLAQYELALNDTNGSQASAKVAAAVRLAGARRCRFEECRFEDLSGYAADLLRGTFECAFARCTMTRLGAGGVRLNGGTDGCHPYARASGNAIEDCEIGPYGTDFRSAVGVLLMNAEKTKVRYNHIFDGWYTGISAGWVWGYGESASHHNEISHNHIHKIGQGCLSDMGGIYMLGPSCGTVVSHNRIHDVDARSYGGWGIYNDEGSSDILIENNVVYDTKFAGYDIHYAKDLTVRNNIFAFGRMDQLARTTRERHVSCTLLNNIVYWTGGRLFSGDWSDAAEPFPVLKPQRNGNVRPQMSTVTFNADANVYFNPNAAVTNVVFGNGLTFGAWRKAGKDRRSVYADPLFVNPATRDFRLKPGSPAYRLGFVDFDQNDVGPRQPGAKAVGWSSAEAVGQAAPKPVTVYSQPGWCVWCPTPSRLADGRFALVHSRWPEAAGFEAWCMKSEIALAVAENPLGPYRFVGKLLGGAGTDGAWDRDVTHNPYLFAHGGKYYLYYMGTHGTAGNRRSFLSHQRIGIAVSDKVEGPWRRDAQPVFPEEPHRAMCSNPSVCALPDGRILMVYKWMSAPWSTDPEVHLGAAIAARPEGPFEIVNEDIFPAKGIRFAGEDPCLWTEGEKVVCVIHDMGTNYSPHARALVRFDSTDGIRWTNRGTLMARGTIHRLERPYMMSLPDGKRLLFAASKPTAHGESSQIVAYP